MKEKFNFTVGHSLTEEDILDILTTAIEQGIYYWACIDNDHPDWIEARNQWKSEHNDVPCWCDTAFRVMQNGKAIIFYDEEDNDKVLELTMDKFLQGCAKFTEWSGKDIHKAIDEADFDAVDADCIIQFALFGEVVYG